MTWINSKFTFTDQRWFLTTDERGRSSRSVYRSLGNTYFIVLSLVSCVELPEPSTRFSFRKIYRVWIWRNVVLFSVASQLDGLCWVNVSLKIVPAAALHIISYFGVKLFNRWCWRKQEMNVIMSIAPSVQQKAFDLRRLILVPLMAGSRWLHGVI